MKASNCDGESFRRPLLVGRYAQCVTHKGTKRNARSFPFSQHKQAELDALTASIRRPKPLLLM